MWWTGGTLRCQNVRGRYCQQHLLRREERAWSATKQVATGFVSFSSVSILFISILLLQQKYRRCWALAWVSLCSPALPPPLTSPCACFFYLHPSVLLPVSLNSFICNVCLKSFSRAFPFESGTRVRREFVASHAGPRSKLLFLPESLNTSRLRHQSTLVVQAHSWRAQIGST